MPQTLNLVRRSLVLGVLGLATAACAMRDAADVPPKSVVFFNAFSADLDAPALGTIAQFATDAKRVPNRPVLVEGYADSVGTPRSNAMLSALRGQVVADALAAQGIERSRLVLRPRGPTAVDPGIESRRVDLEIGS